MRDAVHLTLRDYQEADIDAIHQLLNNYQVSRFLSFRIPFPYTRDDAVWWVETGSKSEITRVIEYNQKLWPALSVWRVARMRIIAVVSLATGWANPSGAEAWQLWL